MIRVQSSNSFYIKKPVSLNNQTPPCNSKSLASDNFRESKMPADAIRARYMTSNSVAFGSLRRIGSNGPLDTCFFRAYEAMKFGAKAIKTAHPEGATVIHLFGSTGEEAYANKMILGDNYRVISLDNDPDAVQLARNFEHSVCNNNRYDSFVLEDNTYLTKEQKYLRSQFHKMFAPTTPPQNPLSNTKLYKEWLEDPEFVEKFFKVRESAKNSVEFRDASMGNILNIDKFEPDTKVSAIYAQNGLYYLTDNHSMEVILFGRKSNEPNLKVLDEIADKTHKRLEDDGIFVVGNSLKEHLFMAPEDLPDSETIKLCDTSLYNKFSPARLKGLRFMKNFPLQQSLEKDGKFEPVFWDYIDEIPEISVPTVWKKVPTNN